jgi:hypothetical protein
MLKSVVQIHLPPPNFSLSIVSLWMFTMNRCSLHSPPSFKSNALFSIATYVLLTLTSTLFSVNLAAQGFVREFPAKALRGTMVVVQAPQITIDGKREQLSPGARIRGVNNMLAMSASLTGAELLVNYTREVNGYVHEVWILTPDEAKLKRESGSKERNFSFGSEADNSPKDDGKTPFNQLPKYKQ